VPPPLLNGEDDDGLTLKPVPPTIPCIPMTFMMMEWGLGGKLRRDCSLLERGVPSASSFSERDDSSCSALTTKLKLMISRWLQRGRDVLGSNRQYALG